MEKKNYHNCIAKGRVKWTGSTVSSHFLLFSDACTCTQCSGILVLLICQHCGKKSYPFNAPAQEVGLEDLILGEGLAALEDAESLGNGQTTVHLA